MSHKRSLDRAIEFARKIRVSRQVLSKLEMCPMSETLHEVRKDAASGEEDELLGELNQLIDLEVTEIELADRIVATSSWKGVSKWRAQWASG